MTAPAPDPDRPGADIAPGTFQDAVDEFTAAWSAFAQAFVEAFTPVVDELTRLGLIPDTPNPRTERTPPAHE